MPECRSCNADLPAGLRWCTICHASVVGESGGRLASPGKRLAAYVLDLAMPGAAALMMLGVFGAGVSTGGDAGTGLGFLVALLMLVTYVVWALRLFASGTTPGKHLLGLHVQKESGERAGFGTMLLREWIGKWISGMVFSLGYIWILIDQNRQGWHDKLASTYVVE